MAAFGPPGGDNGREMDDPVEAPVPFPAFSEPDSGPEVSGEAGRGDAY